MRIDIAGVMVDNITTSETLDKIREFVGSGQPHHIVTTYSEFIVEAQTNSRFREVINQSALSLPDGVGVIWAAKFLAEPKQDLFLTYLSWLGSLGSIILAPSTINTVIKEKVSGSKLVWDIAQLAEKNNFSLALVGGLDGVAGKAAAKLKEKFPNLKINLAVSDMQFNGEMVQRIAASNSDILLIAYQPPKQEIWLADNLQNLNVKVAMGLGGTFDYLAGKREPAPEWMIKIGLEWFWRLITQPQRLGRMWKAIPVFSWIILNHKTR